VNEHCASRRRWLIGIAVIFVLSGLTTLPRLHAAEQSDSLQPAGTPLYPSDNERLGFGVTRGIENYDVSPLRAGWYVNWGTAPQAAHPAMLDFAQIIRTSNAGYSPNGSALTSIIDRNPGSLWLIGNEPDCPYQDNVLPANYARVYHDAYQAIKGRDPTAQVAIGGIVQATPLRLQWLEMAWNEYRARYGQVMPVDVWNVHAFVLREVRPGHGRECQPPGATEGGEWGSGIPPGVSVNCGLWIGIDELDRLDLFQQNIVRFRTWMHDHGQQNKPLIISEYGILFNAELGYGYERVRNYMLATFDYFLSTSDPSLGYPADDYRLVQRWAWYSLDDDNFVWGTTYSALMDPDTRTLYPLGYDFARYASARVTPYVDLQPAAFRASTANPIAYGQTGTVRLQVDVSNRGNTASAASQVRFWDGNPDQGGVLLGTVALPAVPVRYASVATATLNWSVAAQGNHTITVQVDPANQVTESREDNNRATFAVNFGTVNLAVGAPGWQLTRGPLRPGEATQITLNPVPVSMTRPTPPSTGLAIAPPAYRVTWYDGDPDAGGQAIGSTTMPAPATFPAYRWTPTQPWAPVISEVTAFGSARQVWLVVRLENGAAETDPNDNRVALTIPAATDLTLVQARQAEIPLSQPGVPVDVQLRLRVANAGTLAPSTQLSVALWAGTAPAGPAIASTKLAAEGDWTNPLTWPGLEVGTHAFVAWVDPEDDFPESNEGNNQLADVAVVAGFRAHVPDLGVVRPPGTNYVPLLAR
jgi:hypothetical protein